MNIIYRYNLFYLLFKNPLIKFPRKTVFKYNLILYKIICNKISRMKYTFDLISVSFLEYKFNLNAINAINCQLISSSIVPQ